MTVMGAKQTINKVAMVTTIFDTFILRLETLSAWTLLVVLFLHSELLRSLADKTTVLMATITNEHRGIKKLLTAKVNLSTCSLSSRNVSPIVVLFFKKEYFMPSLLTTYMGVALNERMTKIHTVITPDRSGVIICLTCIETETKVGVNIYFTCQKYFAINGK